MKAVKAGHALVWACGGLVALGLAGCYHHHHEEEVYVAPQPAYVVAAEPPPGGTLVVAEPRPYQPGPGYIWIDGYWAWNGQRWVVEHGHWAVPPSGRRVWVAPHYERYGHEHRYVPGYWR
jgi:hypothetical protein